MINRDNKTDFPMCGRFVRKEKDRHLTEALNTVIPLDSSLRYNIALSQLVVSAWSNPIVIGADLRKGFKVLIQFGHVPFATSHAGIHLSNRPTEDGRISMKIGGLNGRPFIDLPAPRLPKMVPDTHYDEGNKAGLTPLFFKAIFDARKQFELIMN